MARFFDHRLDYEQLQIERESLNVSKRTLVKKDHKILQNYE
jgi:hypothetical protein